MWKKDWWIKAGKRALRTCAQALLAAIGTGATVGSVNWKTALSMMVMAGIVSILTSISLGMPEYEKEDGGI